MVASETRIMEDEREEVGRMLEGWREREGMREGCRDGQSEREAGPVLLLVSGYL